jgi:hypothetical protein
MQKKLTIYIKGSRRVSNFFWAFVITVGSFSFFLNGLASFFKRKLPILSESTIISFLPQGITLLFYGTAGLILGIFLWLTIWWDVGFGYNEYNKEKQEVLLYRRGFPGAKQSFSLKFPFKQLKSIKMFLKEGINPRRQLFLCLQDGRQIPITGIDQTFALNEIETQALDLAKYLNIYLETS